MHGGPRLVEVIAVYAAEQYPIGYHMIDSKAVVVAVNRNSRTIIESAHSINPYSSERDHQSRSKQQDQVTG
jgi:hypothetical protein